MSDVPRTYVDNAIAWAKSQLGNTDYRGKMPGILTSDSVQHPAASKTRPWDR